MVSATTNTIEEKENYRFDYGKSLITIGTGSLHTFTTLHCSSKLLNIYFKCQRFIPQIDETVATVYNAIISGKDLSPYMKSNLAGCSHLEVMGRCGYFRGSLNECRCDALDRLKFPNKRAAFENYVIIQILDIINSSKSNFKINIAIFASGGLHGEEVLLFKLFEKIRKGYKGTVCISLIDWAYKGNIVNSKFAPSELVCRGLAPSIGDRTDLEQFLKETSFCLPPDITLEGRVFGSMEDYILHTQSGTGFKHDLLIGADIENTGKIVGEINHHAGKTSRPAIALLKEQEEKELATKVCAITRSPQGTYIFNCLKV